MFRTFLWKLILLHPIPNLPQGGGGDGATGVRIQDHRHFRVDSPSAKQPYLTTNQPTGLTRLT